MLISAIDPEGRHWEVIYNNEICTYLYDYDTEKRIGTFDSRMYKRLISPTKFTTFMLKENPKPNTVCIALPGSYARNKITGEVL